MHFADVLATAFGEIRANKIRSFFTLLGIIVSVTFLVAVVAIIQGMNAYVSENLAGALIGQNTFQVRRSPIQLGLFDDEQFRRIQKRPRITESDAEAVIAAIPEAVAIGIQSGWPTPVADVQHSNKTLGDVAIFGVTAPYQVIQDYSFASGRPLTEVDDRERRPVAVVGHDVADRLFENVDPVGRDIRIMGSHFTIVGVFAKKGRVLGQSFDGFVLLPLSSFEAIYGRRLTTTISVKMATAVEVAPAMALADGAMRAAHRLRPGQESDYSIETLDALVEFWKNLTRVLFAVIPAIVAIGIVVGGIVIMNIMMMSVSERTREIGIRKAMGATSRDIRRQFLVESIALAFIGGLTGVMVGWAMAALVATVSPLPARITAWSVAVALSLGAGVGVLFGVYPATRAARLDPIAALRAE
ncbi:MAG TPA: ABC transporter permease [Gemmatimonadaceae bacterium]|nr:ABC transporter permease [Gemmatimonadaceae bacterium]